MALPTSGPLSLDNIQTEFGGTNPISLNEYYAGGANVPAGTSGTFGAVPASGTISIQNFYGTSNVVYVIQTDSYNDFGIVGVDLTAGITFTVGSGGVVTVTGDVSGAIASYNWITPTTGSTTHFVRATLSSGTFNSGATGSFLALTANQSWEVRETGSGFRSTTATFEIATDSGGTNIVASGVVTFDVELF